jgi:RNase P/RNase MRP subunit p29
MQELTKKVEKRIEGIVGRVSAECRKSLMIVFEKAKVEGCKEVKNEGNYSIII